MSSLFNGIGKENWVSNDPTLVGGGVELGLKLIFCLSRVVFPGFQSTLSSTIFF